MRTRKLKPRKESEEKIQPYTRSAFHGLLTKAIKTPAAKPAPKSS
jgi:hypothetical protein